jgi:hypothetical protein
VLPDQVNETECATGSAPVPESLIVIGEFEASLVTVTLPVAFPVAAGANVALSDAVCPADKTNPKTPPPALKPAPVTTTFKIVTLESPALVSVTLLELLLDTFTSPKASVVEVAFRRRVAACTVRTAALLLVVPALLLTTTANCAALSEVFVAAVV